MRRRIAPGGKSQRVTDPIVKIEQDEDEDEQIMQEIKEEEDSDQDQTGMMSLDVLAQVASDTLEQQPKHKKSQTKDTESPLKEGSNRKYYVCNVLYQILNSSVYMYLLQV